MIDLPDPNEDGITQLEQATRMGMARRQVHHPDFTERELRMDADIDMLLEWIRTFEDRVPETLRLSPALLADIAAAYD